MNSGYKAYPSYKDSGVEWLGDVPREWTCSKLKHKVIYQVGGTPSTKNTDNFVGTHKWATISDLKAKYISETKSNISDGGISATSMTITPKDSLLLSFKLSVGTVSFINEDMYTNEAIASFLKNNDSDLNYLYYTLPLFVVMNASENIYGAKILNQELINNTPLPLPPISEQQSIARFLDNATGKIDTLISKQHDLIKLLKEKRQAVISHAVTKGLDPTVEFKDSGVEWLGEIPSGWGVSSLKFLLSESLMYGANESADRDNPGDPRYIRITDIKSDGTLHDHTFKSLPIEIAKPYILKKNSILLARSGATVGKSFLYDMSWGKSCFAGYLIKAVINHYKAHPKFIYYFTTSKNYWQWLSSVQIQSTIENVSAEKYAGLSISLPCISDQGYIVDYLDDKTSKIDLLVIKSTQSIELLKEKRTALISAAVTGKIDVRDVA